MAVLIVCRLPTENHQSRNFQQDNSDSAVIDVNGLISLRHVHSDWLRVYNRLRRDIEPITGFVVPQTSIQGFILGELLVIFTQDE